ncbi:MAG: signal recognition particle receptor subunit alpha, partial [Gammaproteobacteria bacterium]
MFENLSDRLTRVVKNIKGEARITEANTQEMLREVRLALLEADVALPVVKEFINQVKEQALGEEVLNSLTPGQALVGIVHKQLIKLIG